MEGDGQATPQGGGTRELGGPRSAAAAAANPRHRRPRCRRGSLSQSLNDHGPSAIDTLINEELATISTLADAHKAVAEKFRRNRRLLEYPQTLLAGFLSSALAANASAGPNAPIGSLTMLGLSTTVFVLNVTLKHFKYADREAEHDTSSKQYTNILRLVQVRLIRNNLSLEQRKDIFAEIIGQCSLIEQYELPLPDWSKKASATDAIVIVQDDDGDNEEDQEEDDGANIQLVNI